MSKEIIISGGIIICIIFANLLVSHIIDGRLEYLVGQLDELRNILVEKRYDEADEKIKKIDEYWDNSEDLLSCYIEHDELEKVKTEYTSLKVWINLEDDSVFESLEKMFFIIRHIEEKDDLKLKNIL